jgi:hypothetical protein
MVDEYELIFGRRQSMSKREKRHGEQGGQPGQQWPGKQGQPQPTQWPGKQGGQPEHKPSSWPTQPGQSR